MAARAQEAILDATRELLGEVGFARLSIEAVAKRAGVGKPTIYRWWPDKSRLVFDAVADLADALDEELDLDFEASLRWFVGRVVHHLTTPGTIESHPALYADRDAYRRVYEASVQPSIDHFRRLVRRGIDAGDVRPEIDADLLFDLIVGGLVQRTTRRALLGEQPLATAVDDVVDLVLPATSPAPPRGG
ncbi:MAG: ydeS [Actinomycetia bacterium]|nr:ydeS [Actinomycetes bacterium]